jgi:hypothetical protein
MAFVEHGGVSLLQRFLGKLSDEDVQVSGGRTPLYAHAHRPSLDGRSSASATLLFQELADG